MPRWQRPFQVNSQLSVTVGSTDQQTLIDLVAPFSGARVGFWSLTQKTAGTGTGSFTIIIEEQGGADLTPTLTIDPDAVAETVLGSGTGNGVGASATGVHLAVKTTKSGAVTGSPVMLLNVLWLM